MRTLIAAIAQMQAVPAQSLPYAIRCLETMNRPHSSGTYSYGGAERHLKDLGVTVTGLFHHDRAELVRIFTPATTEMKAA